VLTPRRPIPRARAAAPARPAGWRVRALAPALLGLLVLLAAGCAGHAPYVALSPAHLERGAALVRAGGLAEAARALEDDCRKALAAPLPTVVRPGKAELGIDPHDYASLAYYYWPNPETPDGLPWILRDGEASPAAQEDPDRLALETVCKSAALLAQGYRLTGNAACAEGAARLLRVFFLDPATRMNPNLEHAQRRPGRDDGSSAGIIDTALLAMLVDVPALLEGSPAFTSGDRRGLRRWMSAYLDWLLASAKGREEAARANNHGTWYDVQVVGLALACGRPGVADACLARAPARLDAQFDAQGLQPEEARRTKSLNYHLFNLEAWFTLAVMAQARGVDLWDLSTPSGASLRKGLDALRPCLTGEKPWPYRQIAELTPRNRRQAAFLLRLAALRWGDAGYEADLKTVLGRTAARQRLQLLFPASGA